MSTGVEGTARARWAAIDLVKAVAIVMVVLQHALPQHLQDDLGRQFLLQPAVPLFLLVMGLNGGASQARRGGSLRERYTASYWRSRADRLLVPFVLVWVVAFCVGTLRGGVYLGPLTVLGAVPIDAPGSYYIGLLGQFVVLFPLLAWAFERRPVAVTVLVVGLNVLFEVWAGGHRGFLDQPYPYAYHSCLLRFGALLVLGLWLSRRSDVRTSARSPLALVVVALSTAALVVWSLAPGTLDWTVQGFGRPTSLFFCGYALGLVLLATAVVPDRVAAMPAWRPVRALSDASYHVFLVQMLWFGIVRPQPSVATALVALIASALLGVAFQRALDLAPRLERRPALAGRTA